MSTNTAPDVLPAPAPAQPRANHSTRRRPPGRARVHRLEPVGRLSRPLAVPLYRVVFDPDGRSRRMRRAHEF